MHVYLSNSLYFVKYVYPQACLHHNFIAMPKLRRLVKAALLVSPVLITVYNQVGYVGIVRGRSMRVRRFQNIPENICILSISCMNLIL